MLHILLPVHNRIEITKRFIGCLKKQTYKDWHLLLIDDGSKDGTSEYVTKEIENCSVIKGKGNWWWAGSLQQGINWLKINAMEKDFVLILNDDVIYEPDFLQIGTGLLKDSANTIFMAKNYSMQTKRLIDYGKKINWSSFAFDSPLEIKEINCFSTRGLFLRYNDILFIGDFFPKILPHYGSDYEYTYRAFKKGYKLSINDCLYLYGNEMTTGVRERKKENILEYFLSIMNKKDLRNPQIWFGLIILACPWKYKLKNSFRVIKNILIGGIKCLIKF